MQIAPPTISRVMLRLLSTSFTVAMLCSLLPGPVIGQDSDERIIVVIETTMGSIRIGIDTLRAPITTANFLRYVKSGFYNNLIFHRVMENFVIQSGGFDVGLVKKTPGPPIINESYNGLSNLRGTIAMARTPAPDSATSQYCPDDL